MNQQDMLELGAVVIGALALLVVLRRGGSTSPIAVPEVQSVASPYGQPPTYLGINQPTNAGSGNSLGLSAVAAAEPCNGRQSRVSRPLDDPPSRGLGHAVAELRLEGQLACVIGRLIRAVHKETGLAVAQEQQFARAQAQ